MDKFDLTTFSFLFSICLFGQTQLGQNISVPDNFFAVGLSVATSQEGSRVVVGGYGKSSYGFRVYDYINNDWTQLPSVNNTEYPNDVSVYSVSISSNGNRVAIGAVKNLINNDLGHFKVYDYDGTNWSQVGLTIYGETNDDFFGQVLELSASGMRLVVGAKFNDQNGNSSGHARIFQYNGADWFQLGSDLDGDYTAVYFGTSVSMSSDGSRVAIGANQYYDNNDPNQGNIGLIRIFEYNGVDWIQIGDDLNGEFIISGFGVSSSFSVNGNRIVIGAYGHAEVYEYDGTNWMQIGTDLIGEQGGESFGRSVSLSDDGNVLAIGAISSNGLGYVRLYLFDGTDWAAIGNRIDGEESNDEFGEAISLSNDGNTLAIGSLTYEYPQSGTEEGYVKVYDVSNLPLSMEDFVKVNYIIYPNPATETIQCLDCQNVIKVDIYDSMGKRVRESLNFTNSINISEFQNGIYYIRIETKQGNIQVVKLVKV